MEYSIENNKLILNGESIDFDYPIKQSLLIGEMIIVLLDGPRHLIYNENIFGVDIIKKIVVWQVQRMQHRYVQDICPYTYIKKTDRSTAILINWCSFSLEVDPEDGSIIKEGMWK